MILKQRKIIIGIAAALLALVVIIMISILIKSKEPVDNEIAKGTERKTEQVSHESEQIPAVTTVNQPVVPPSNIAGVKMHAPVSPLTDVDFLMTYLKENHPDLSEKQYDAIGRFYTMMVKERLMLEASMAVVTKNEAGDSVIEIEPYAKQGASMRNASVAVVLQLANMAKDSPEASAISGIIKKGNSGWGADRQIMVVRHYPENKRYSIEHTRIFAPTEIGSGSSTLWSEFPEGRLGDYTYIISQID
ncbi:MAG: hypothetical protein LBM04_04785 [Opitutaceae bacterium]|jgi:hypothetical protein|nr:hypothetical protein [Opitutaceae bacterium]